MDKLEPIPVNGKEQVMEMFNAADDELKNSILEGIQNRNRKLYLQLRQMYVKFEDLIRLDMDHFQELLKYIPKKRLFLSLRLASFAFRHKVYQCVTDRQIEEIEHYLHHGAKESVTRVKSEQQEVVKIAKRLHDSGQINIQTTRTDIWV